MATTAKTKTRGKAAPKLPSRKIEDSAQYERFREFARKVETNDEPQEFDKRFRQLVRPSTDSSS